MWCNAKALSTGAILVDLPGVADANAARNNIAKDYMKKCDCVWILAPITRAVDDKTARGERMSGPDWLREWLTVLGRLDGRRVQDAAHDGWVLCLTDVCRTC